MVLGLFRRKSDDRAGILYEEAVSAARRAAFYRDLGVPDTVDGRLEMLMIHVGLLVARLMADERTRDLARDLSEAFFADMDRTLREMGVGDLSVPKKMKKMASAFYGRLQAYGEAADDGALAAALARNVYEGDAAAPSAALARYMRAAAAELAAADTDVVAGGRAVLPDPAAFAPQEPDR